MEFSEYAAHELEKLRRKRARHSRTLEHREEKRLEAIAERQKARDKRHEDRLQYRDMVKTSFKIGVPVRQISYVLGLKFETVANWAYRGDRPSGLYKGIIKEKFPRIYANLEKCENFLQECKQC